MNMTLYQSRRAALFNTLPKSSVVILSGYQQKVRSKNIKYHFRQDNDFLYLTGFNEPDAVAILCSDKNTDTGYRYTLLCRPKNEALEVSFGERAGLTGAISQYGADDSFDIAELEKVVLAKIDQHTHFFISDECDRFNTQITGWLNNQRRNSSFDTIKQYRSLTPLAKYLHPMRVIKSDEEIAQIKAAVVASTAGHISVMQACKAGVNEALLSATFNFTISQFGCTEVAYPNIVAAGNNACCLHYEENCSDIVDGQILLIDAGGELAHYASDITRSYPVNGKFTNSQKAIYQLVLNALDAAIANVAPGTAWNTLYETCMKVMARGLLELGLLSGTLEEVMAAESYKRFTVHKTGHWLGMDVHDVGPYHDENGEWRKLEPGMVFTIEPGIYIPLSATDVPVEYRGMGIRIEDDILVTQHGHDNLSVHIPRTIDEIEKTMTR
ncbi:aminopeptidase P N-terminal domain-containing protein [Shewanella sp. D64]|uniref:aminopeptidase P N-terminal domain-containing protein n=1 Tax=unclassified Shewanella TaxID=196818 RepID=UPI0022BA62E8|nr:MULTISPECIES: aminopeptidase P N-terminal domain-containing protein [unclassified Shewanella]MEC4728792.1 aminopeptidase P N-terminal domain-containing protein [Shewanella sp. D64]MEC4740666.1 aminopeptidase P N-terminal domain-containing protein [Shewanella sp. E94]WBJ93351.1 aminopeptidase P N-terminal domain-containing protein [Shewanella sp. MTB7]